MKLKWLDLKAFGPFTDRIIELSSEGPGLHIVFGPNEAGKSSALRALKALLYGFAQQTPDNFIHRYDQLRVGGCVVNSTGQELIFYRRKRRIGDIVDADGNPLDDTVLTPFLNGIAAEIFESLYGIDHDALVLGGREILNQKGEVGQALFAAGAGISSIRQVTDQLEKEAAELFKRTGRRPLINQSIKRFKALQKEVKAASLSGRIWRERQKALKDARRLRDDLEKERDAKEKEIRHLERLAQAIPELAALNSRRRQLVELGEVIPLEPNFAHRHQQVLMDMHEAERQLHKDTVRLRKMEEKRESVAVNENLLQHSERVDDLHQRLGEYRKGQKDRPERNGMRISLRKEAARLFRQVRQDMPLDRIEELRPVLAKKRTLQTLIAQNEAIDHQLTLARSQRRSAEQEGNKIEQMLARSPEPKEPGALLRAVRQVQKAGDLDAQIEKQTIHLQAAHEDCRSELERIGLWSGTLSDLMRLALPLAETVQQFERRFSELADERRRIDQSCGSYEKDLEIAQAEMKTLAYGGQVPSEAALNQIREKRQLGWHLLRRCWIDQEDVTDQSRRYDPNRPLVEAYEDYVSQADLIADRLRREADRVAKAETLSNRVEAIQDALKGLERDRDALERRVSELDETWLRQWQPMEIMPLSPKEMRGWLTQIEQLRFKVGETRKAQQTLDADLERRAHLRQVLHEALVSAGEETPSSGESLAPMLVESEAVLDKFDRQTAEWDRLKERHTNSEKTRLQALEDLKDAQQALSTWQGRWRTAVEGLAPKAEVDTLEAFDRMEMLQSCFDKLKEADDLQKRIDGIDRDAVALERAVGDLVGLVAPDLSQLPPDQAILELRTRHRHAQKQSTVYHELTREIEGAEEEISVGRKRHQDAREHMAELMSLAKCDQPDQLTAVMRRFTEYQRLQAKISDIEANLAKIGAGVEIQTLAEQTAEIDADTLLGRIQALRRDVEERIHPEINRISQQIGELTHKLTAMDGNAKAAEFAEQSERELAGLRRLADRYVLLKLASKILRQEIERYREEHQDPVLQKASDYFSQLSTGSFEALRTDVSDKGDPILVGIRPDGLRLTVEKMSSGTRDQLYLALRLATLEWRLESHEAMPFIVDDILINFDDERSKATLAVLADISQKNQVILFTHHGQIVDAANRMNTTGALHIHNL